MRPSVVRAPATDTCWPTIARTASSNPSVVPGSRVPGAERTARQSAGSPASTSSIASGSASRSNRRRDARTTLASSGTSSPTPVTRNATTGSDGSGSSSITTGGPASVRIARE